MNKTNKNLGVFMNFHKHEEQEEVISINIISAYNLQIRQN